MEQISKRVYVETEFGGCNTSFIDTGDGVVLVDTPMIPAEAAKWKAEMEKHGPLRYIIDCEPHPDHFGGNCYFDGIVVGQEGTRTSMAEQSVDELKEMITRSSPDSAADLKDYCFRLPAITFTDELTLHLGDLTLRLVHLPGHTASQLAVYIPEEKVVIAADNVTSRLPVFRDAVPYGWLESLKKMKMFDAEKVVTGHGDVRPYSYVDEMYARVKAWIDAVSEALEKGMPEEEAREKLAVNDPFLEESKDIPFIQQMAKGNIEYLYKSLGK